VKTYEQVADFDEQDVSKGRRVGDLSVERDASESELSGKRHAYVADPRPRLPARHERAIVHILHCLV
jgi:hypothetical protein